MQNKTKPNRNFSSWIKQVLSEISEKKDKYGMISLSCRIYVESEKQKSKQNRNRFIGYRKQAVGYQRDWGVGGATKIGEGDKELQTSTEMKNRP